MSDIIKKDNSIDNISDVDFAKIAAALLGIEYPGDEFFEDGKIKTIIGKIVQDDNLSLEENETAILQRLIDLGAVDRVRSVPFRKQSFSAWQSARLRNFAKAGIISPPKEGNDVVRGETVRLTESDDIVTVDDILSGNASSHEDVDLFKSEQDDEFTVDKLDNFEDIVTILSNESAYEEKEVDVLSEEGVVSKEESKDASYVTPVIMRADTNVQGNSHDLLSDDEADYGVQGVQEVTVLEKKSGTKLRPPVMPEYNPDKPIYFAHIETKPRKIRRTSNAPHIIPAHSEPIEFSPKGGKYREI